MLDTQLHIAIKSYKRPDRVSTISVFPYAWIWVPESQAAEYRQQYYGDRVIAIPDELDGNLSRKQNAILDRTPCPWTLILDDDITNIGYFEGGERRKIVDPDKLLAFILHGFDMAAQLGVELWGVNQNGDQLLYKAYNPLSFLSPVLGPFHGHLSPTLRYDESVLGKDDYDFWLQNIRKFHRTLRFDKYHYNHGHALNKGGFVSMRTKATEQAGIDRMIQKWGDKVYQPHGTSGGHHATGKNILNSIVRVPIKGA